MTDGYDAERTLVLLRHAKADRPDGVADRERPLTVRGKADATAAGAWLARHGLRPDLVLCSPARRTRETWEAVTAGMAGTAVGGDPDRPAPRVEYESALYAAETADLLAVLRAVAPDAGTVLLVGHDPSISLLSIVLDRLGADREGLRTSGIVVHRVAGEWSALGTGPAPVVAHHTPRA